MLNRKDSRICSQCHWREGTPDSENKERTYPEHMRYWHKLNKRELEEKIEDWHNRMAEELDHAPSYIFPQSILIIKEMKEVLDSK